MNIKIFFKDLVILSFISILGLFSAESISAAIIVSDNFDRADTSILGDGWVEDLGDWTINNNILVPPVQVEAIVHNTNTPSSPDYYVQVDESASEKVDFIAVLARFTDTNNFYLFQSGKGFAQLWKRVNGGWTILYSGPFDRQANTFNSYRIEVVGSQISGFIDNVLVASANDGSITNSGYGGLRRGGEIGVLNFNNYEVGELSTPAPTPTPIPSNSFFSDGFDDPDSTDLGNGWVEDSSDWAINSNQLVIPSQTQDESIIHNSITPKLADYYVQVDTKSNTNDFTAVLARFVDVNNFYLLQIGKDQVHLYKKINGAWSALDGELLPLSSDIFHTLRIEVNGNQIRGYVDGSQVIYATDTSLTEVGFGGLRRGGHTAQTVYEDFSMGYLFKNVAPSVGSINVFSNPIQVNTEMVASTYFSDSNAGDDHTAVWDWGDGISTNGTVTEENGFGTITDTHTYSSAGVYTVVLTVTDSASTSNSSTYQFVSVFNPTSQGLFTAGQNYSSPSGAYPQDQNLTGIVRFGLAYKYQGTIPVENRQFTMTFPAANLEFNATTLSSLVISNNMATLTGTGTINGLGNYTFFVIGIDGGGIRIQIRDTDNNNIVYDNQPGALMTVIPTTSVNGHVIAHN